MSGPDEIKMDMLQACIIMRGGRFFVEGGRDTDLEGFMEGGNKVSQSQKAKGKQESEGQQKQDPCEGPRRKKKRLKRPAQGRTEFETQASRTREFWNRGAWLQTL